MIKNTKLALMFMAAVVIGGFSSAGFAQTAPAKSADKLALEALVQFPGSQPAADLDIPVPLKAFAEDTKGAPQACVPSPALIPGKGYTPVIDDQVRVAAITDLLSRIAGCKPLPYSHDGITNNNSEGGMPQAPAGFYKEYTLMVPGRKTGDGPVPVVIGGKTYMTGAMLSARGPERIIVGGGKEIYYTMDHYKTFLHLDIVK